MFDNSCLLLKKQRELSFRQMASEQFMSAKANLILLLVLISSLANFNSEYRLFVRSTATVKLDDLLGLSRILGRAL